MIVIGSQALAIGLKRLDERFWRKPVDLDLIAWPGEMAKFVENTSLDLVKKSENKWLFKDVSDGRMVEIEVAQPGTSAEDYLKWAELMQFRDTAQFYGKWIQIAPLYVLYSLKRSHRHSPRMFSKHVVDYNYLRVMMDGKDVIPEITEKRRKEVVAREKLRTPSLNKNAADFFNDNVSNRTFVHDSIHLAMAFGERPMFERIKIDPNLVACSVDKFRALTNLEQLQCVQEEAYVIALERHIIPSLYEGEKGRLSPQKAYEWAVMRIATTLTSGWFREFALENHDMLMIMYDPGYVNNFLKADEEGKVERVK